MNSPWDILFSFWCIAFSILFFIVIKAIGKHAREVEQLKYKVSLHEDMIVRLGNELEMCRCYLCDHCMFCMYDIDPDRKEENKE